MAWRCCQHCVDPCPANGHTKSCEECGITGVGRKVAEARHYPPGAVRDWAIRGRRSRSVA